MSIRQIGVDIVEASNMGMLNAIQGTIIAVIVMFAMGLLFKMITGVEMRNDRFMEVSLIGWTSALILMVPIVFLADAKFGHQEEAHQENLETIGEEYGLHLSSPDSNKVFVLPTSSGKEKETEVKISSTGTERSLTEGVVRFSDDKAALFVLADPESGGYVEFSDYVAADEG